MVSVPPFSTDRHAQRVAVAADVMEAIPRGKKRDAALAALKERGEVTEAACAAAGRSDGLRASKMKAISTGWTAAEDYIIQCGAKFGWTSQRIAVHLPNRSANAAASRNRHHRLKESARDGPPAEAAEGEAAARRRSSGGGRKALVPPDAPGEKAAAEGGAAKDKGAKPERMSWTKVGR